MTTLGPCSYGDGCWAQTASCVDGTWQLSGIDPTCNPPPPPVEPCPQNQPLVGETCNVAPGAICTFSDQCCSVEYQCAGGVWADVTSFECNPPAPVCPVDPPEDGAPCYQDPCVIWACSWDLCAQGQGYVDAKCASGAWMVAVAECQ